MATHGRLANQIQIHTTQLRHDLGGARSLILQGPSKSKILTVLALLHVGGILLGLAGITLVGTMIGIAVATPVFVIFSPVIVQAALTVGLAVAGFLTSGTFGLTGLSSLSFLVNCVCQATGWLPENIEDVAVYAGRNTEEVGQMIRKKAREMGAEGQSQGGGSVGKGQSQSQVFGKSQSQVGGSGGRT